MMGWATDEMIKRYDQPNFDDQANALAQLEETRELRRILKAEKKANEELRQSLVAAQKDAFEGIRSRSAPETAQASPRIQ